MSPIIGLTDSVRPAFPLLGKLRKGAAQGERGPGRDLDHFRFTSDNPAIVTAFQQAYGAEPRTIACVLPYATVEDSFPTWREAWVAGGLQHRCDGVTCVIWLTDKGTYSREAVPCPGGCKQVGRLNLILPELVRAGHVGYVTVETHSVNDLLNLQASLEAAAQLAPNGDLRGIRWVLRRVPERISTPARNGGRARRESWMLKLTPEARWAQRQLEMALRAGDVEVAARPSLPAWTGPAHVDRETGEILDAAEDGDDGAPADFEFEEAEEVPKDPPRPEAVRAETGDPPPSPAKAVPDGDAGARPAPEDAPDWDRLGLEIVRRQLPVSFRESFVALARASRWGKRKTMAELRFWQQRYGAEPDQALADLRDIALAAGGAATDEGSRPDTPSRRGLDDSSEPMPF